MKKDEKVFLHDMMESIEKIEAYMRNVSKKEFSEQTMIQDAVIRRR